MSKLDSVEVSFYSEALDRDFTINCVYKFYKGMAATKTDPLEAPERDFHSVIDINTGDEILDELSDEDKDTINDKIDEIMSEGGQ
jgi:hypothetical protein